MAADALSYLRNLTDSELQDSDSSIMYNSSLADSATTSSRSENDNDATAIEVDVYNKTAIIDYLNDTGHGENFVEYFNETDAKEVSSFFGTNDSTEIVAMTLHPLPFSATISVALILLSLGNLLVIGAPFASKELRRTRAIVLISLLAFANFWACIFAAAENIYHIVYPTMFPIDQLECLLYMSPYHISSFWCSLLVVAIGVERVLVIRVPFYYRFSVTKRRLAIGGMLTLPVACFAFGFIYFRLRKVDKSLPTCTYRTSLENTKSGWPAGSMFMLVVSTLGVVIYAVFAFFLVRRHQMISHFTVKRITVKLRRLKTRICRPEKNDPLNARSDRIHTICEFKQRPVVPHCRANAKHSAIAPHRASVGDPTDSPTHSTLYHSSKGSNRSQSALSSAARRGSAPAATGRKGSRNGHNFFVKPDRGSDSRMNVAHFDQSSGLMKSLACVVLINVVAWIITLAVVFWSVGLKVESVEELKTLVYLSPLMYVNYVCNFFIYAWGSSLYFVAYKRLIQRIFCCRQLPIERSTSSTFRNSNMMVEPVAATTARNSRV